MEFNKDQYKVESIVLEGETICFRAFRNLIYVLHPVCAEYQRMNIYAPECYYDGKMINGYTLETAPVLMPNQVGGYMPGDMMEPGKDKHGRPNIVFRALQHGYVVAAPAVRGRTLKDENGKYVGKAPACIVDYKAAIRYLHYYSKELPGDETKIITNGTSAGGALSALAGATGNHPDYEELLNELGAAEAGDEIYAASCYCPITDLEHADMAYEWQFRGVHRYHRKHMQMDEGGRPMLSQEDGQMTEEQIRVSEEEAEKFVNYMNGLRLAGEDGQCLQLDAQGKGNFLEYVKSILQKSAQTALDAGTDLSDQRWLTIRNGKIESVDFEMYVRQLTRMKTAPAFDALTMDSAENNLFGTDTQDCCHFTEYSRRYSKAGAVGAAQEVIRCMNPLYYLGDENADTAHYWRIRHGECDRDTSLAVSVILTRKLAEQGCEVDYQVPWDTGHSGNYDLKELFDWIDDICILQ